MNPHECCHGRLARKCEICEYERNIAELSAENAQLKKENTMTNQRARQIQLAEIAVVELLLANEAADPYTHARRISNAIQTAQAYAAINQPVGADLRVCP